MIYFRTKNLFLAIHITLFQKLTYLFIVMQRKDIGDRVFPTIINNDRSISVNTLCQIVNSLRKMLLSYIRLYLTDTPGLIKRCPRDDTRMIIILLYNFQPFLRKLFHRIIREIIGRCHLTPNEHTLHITPI